MIWLNKINAYLHKYMYLSTKWLLMFIPPPGAYELTCHPSFKRIISILAATMKISSAWGIKSKFEIFSPSKDSGEDSLPIMVIGEIDW